MKEPSITVLTSFNLQMRQRSTICCSENLNLLRNTPKPIRNHVSNILGKLHFADRTEEILLARDAGLA